VENGKGRQRLEDRDERGGTKGTLNNGRDDATKRKYVEYKRGKKRNLMKKIY
jgi:hypothetical protein